MIKKLAREKELNDFKQSLIDILKKQQNDEKFLKEKLEELENKTPKKYKPNDFWKIKGIFIFYFEN